MTVANANRWSYRYISASLSHYNHQIYISKRFACCTWCSHADLWPMHGWTCYDGQPGASAKTDKVCYKLPTCVCQLPPAEMRQVTFSLCSSRLWRRSEKDSICAVLPTAHGQFAAEVCGRLVFWGGVAVFWKFLHGCFLHRCLLRWMSSEMHVFWKLLHGLLLHECLLGWFLYSWTSSTLDILTWMSSTWTSSERGVFWDGCLLRWFLNSWT